MSKAVRCVFLIGLLLLLAAVAAIALFLYWTRPAESPPAPDAPAMLFARAKQDNIYESWLRTLDGAEIPYQMAKLDFGEGNFQGMACYVLQKDLSEATYSLNEKSLYLGAQEGYSTEELVLLPFQTGDPVFHYGDFVKCPVSSEN